MPFQSHPMLCSWIIITPWRFAPHRDACSCQASTPSETVSRESTCTRRIPRLTTSVRWLMMPNEQDIERRSSASGTWAGSTTTSSGAWGLMSGPLRMGISLHSIRHAFAMKLRVEEEQRHHHHHDALLPTKAACVIASEAAPVDLFAPRKPLGTARSVT